jgi:hypothetical protein
MKSPGLCAIVEGWTTVACEIPSGVAHKPHSSHVKSPGADFVAAIERNSHEYQKHQIYGSIRSS